MNLKKLIPPPFYLFFLFFPCCYHVFSTQSVPPAPFINTMFIRSRTQRFSSFLGLQTNVYIVLTEFTTESTATLAHHSVPPVYTLFGAWELAFLRSVSTLIHGLVPEGHGCLFVVAENFVDFFKVATFFVTLAFDATGPHFFKHSRVCSPFSRLRVEFGEKVC